jgi:hypothetical protein
VELANKLTECKKKGGILISFTDRPGSKYRLSTRALEITTDRITKRAEKMATEKKWANIHQPDTILGSLANNIDESFTSDHCLITGLLPKYLIEGKMNEAGITALDSAPRGGRFGDGPGPAIGELQDVTNGNRNPIRPSNMRWGRLRFDRLTYLIRLDTPVLVGIGLTGGKSCYERICIAGEEDKRSPGGEWVTRQYLRPREVSHFALMHKDPTPQDVVLLALRGLSRVQEIDNAIMRAVGNYYHALMASPICVHMNVLQHSNNTTPYFDDRIEEPIIIVTLYRGTQSSRIRGVLRNQNKNLPCGELRIGSVILQTFFEHDDITGRAPMITGRLLQIEMPGPKHGSCDIIEAMKRLGSLNHKITLLAKADPTRWRDRWYGILKNPHLEELRTVDDSLTIRDMDIPKLKERAEAYRAEYDSCNMEPVLQPGEPVQLAPPGQHNSYDKSRWPRHSGKGAGKESNPN